MSLNDNLERQQAIDITQSYIIEAGAGAGKSTLMVERFLALLAVVDQPEQVLFCTFTRAATQELVVRVSKTLSDASNKPRPSAPHEQKTYDLAQKVLLRDKSLNWGLLFNISRLNILTLDGLAAKIAKQMPILSSIGGEISVSEDSFPMYNSAAMSVLDAVDEEGSISLDIERLMLHMDGNHQRAVDLIAQMLAKRDQWLRHVVNTDVTLDKEVVEDVLARAVNAIVTSTSEAIAHIKKDVDALLDFASTNVSLGHVLSEGSCPEGYLLRVAELFLTGKNELRKSVTKAQGFPSGKDNAEMKALWKGVSASITENMVSSLATVRKLPVIHYEDSQWDLLNSLFRLLLRAAAELQLVFVKEGQVDFAEVSSRAIAGLMPQNNDRRIAQRMFSMFKHIIVDEVQDINRTQYQLLELLVSEWDDSLENTLCVVGDPKQSIYRFREADVGLFLQAKSNGIANVKLKPLYLTSNFRSSPCIVGFNNDVYQSAFPHDTDIPMGAMPYVASNSEREGNALDGIFTWCIEEPSSEDEALLVSKAIQESLSINQDATVAVLVRSRSHLRSVASQLTKDGIEYQAVDIENISLKEGVQDALTLSKVIMHPLDSGAWLALLRSPCIALSLEDITKLIEPLGADAIIERLSDKARVSTLSEYGKNKIEKLKVSLEWLAENRVRFDAATLIKSVWYQLEMSSGYEQSSIDDVSKFFDLLDEYVDESVIDMTEVERRIERFYAKPNGSKKARQVQLMTIHKSKGLEYDVVIMPGLGNRGYRTDPSLVMWHESTHETTGLPEMMLAPIRSSESDSSKDDDIYDFLMGIEKNKGDLETVRLLYVGTTRAKSRLYMIGAVAKSKPTSSSLFSVIWNNLTPIFHDFGVGDASDDSEEADAMPLIDTNLKRIA